MIEFANQNYWWLWALIPLTALFFIISTKRKNSLLKKLIDKQLWADMLPGKKVSWLSLSFLFLSVFFIILAILRPQWGYDVREVQRKGNDIFVLVDVSQSMKAQDIKPNRLDRAKREILDLLSQLKGDRIGLIPFAGQAYVACPLTGDYQAFTLFLDHLNPDLIPVQGTRIDLAFQKAFDAFSEGKNNSKAIYLISDGELSSQKWSELISRTKEKEIAVFVMGVGTKEGAPIPESEGSGFKEDSNGQIVISKLEEESLQSLALDTGGTYVRSINSDDDTRALYLDGIKRLVEEREIKSGKKEIPIERFQYPLFIGILFFLMFLFLYRN